MITELHLENFKGWKKGTFPLNRINVFFGTNSSGKSSIFQSLLLLKQTAENYDRSRPLHFGDRGKDPVELGSFEDLVFSHDSDLEIGLGLVWEVPGVEVGPSFPIDRISYRGGFCSIEDQLVISRLGYVGHGREDVHFSIERKKDGSYQGSLESPGDQPEKHPLVCPMSCYGIPHAASRKFHPLYPLEFSNQFETLMGRIRYLGPLRQPSDREYRWSGSAPESIGPKGENAVQVMLAGLKQKAKRGQKVSLGQVLHELARRWMGRLGVADEFSLEPIDKDGRFYQVSLKIRGASHRVSIADVGVGVSQVLPVIVHLYFAPPGSILLFEQPEIHLHPSVQASLADLFLEAAEVMGHQILVESHSEHFLVRMQRRIAEAELPLACRENVKLYSCRVGPNGSEAAELALDEYGKIDNWAPDFFGDTLGDREAIMRATFARKKAKTRP